MKDRTSGVYWKTVDLVWSGCVHRRDAAFEGVIANAVRTGFPPCHPSCPPVPLGSRDGRSGAGSKSCATPGVDVDAGQGVRGTAAAHMPSDNGAAIAFLTGDYDQLLRIVMQWVDVARPAAARVRKS
jgi:hypothetical protein